MPVGLPIGALFLLASAYVAVFIVGSLIERRAAKRSATPEPVTLRG